MIAAQRHGLFARIESPYFLRQATLITLHVIADQLLPGKNQAAAEIATFGRLMQRDRCRYPAFWLNRVQPCIGFA